MLPHQAAAVVRSVNCIAQVPPGLRVGLLHRTAVARLERAARSSPMRSHSTDSKLQDWGRDGCGEKGMAVSMASFWLLFPDN